MPTVKFFLRSSTTRKITKSDSESAGERSRIITSSSRPSLTHVSPHHPLSHHENDGHHNAAFEEDCTTTDTKTTERLAAQGMNGECAGSSKAASSHHEFMQISTRNQIPIRRDVVDMVYMEKKYGLLTPEPSTQKVKRWIKSSCSCSLSCLLSLLLSLFPVISWLPKYRLQYAIPDMIAGFTIAILHIPQGMAYGILASLEAENGLYVSFFPVLVYFIFGTSKHVSIGTFAVISLMISSAVANTGAVVTRDYNSTLLNGLNETTSSFNEVPTHLEVATSLAMCVGLLQLFMGIFQLGNLSVLLSDNLVSGFTTGAAVHVATSQLKDLFGIHVGRYSGILKIVYMYRDILYHLASSNAATVIVSAVAIFVLAVVKEHVDEAFRKKVKMPLPIDLIVVVVATAVSYAGDFGDNYNVKIMGPIPTGLPPPTPPRMDLLLRIFTDAFAIAVVAFAISLSMAKLFAKKHNYEISATQELIALGCTNVVSSFFSCYPCSASLSRSLVQERAGGKTQVAGVVSCLLLLVVLLVLAPMFYTLPKCILSAIILVALKGMFLQVKDFVKAWKISKIDAISPTIFWTAGLRPAVQKMVRIIGFIIYRYHQQFFGPQASDLTSWLGLSMLWLVTFLSTVFLDVSYGLVAGVIFSVLTVMFRTALPSRTFLGNIPETDIYLDIERYSMAQEIPGVKIFHFEAALYFINRELFKSTLMQHVPLPNLADLKENMPKTVKSSGALEPQKNVQQIHYIIIDCSSFSYVDTSGLETLTEVMKEYRAEAITVFLAGCSVPMYDMMVKGNFFNNLSYQPCVFPTIHDAISFCYLPSTS